MSANFHIDQLPIVLNDDANVRESIKDSVVIIKDHTSDLPFDETDLKVLQFPDDSESIKQLTKSNYVYIDFEDGRSLENYYNFIPDIDIPQHIHLSNQYNFHFEFDDDISLKIGENIHYDIEGSLSSNSGKFSTLVKVFNVAKFRSIELEDFDDGIYKPTDGKYLSYLEDANISTCVCDNVVDFILKRATNLKSLLVGAHRKFVDDFIFEGYTLPKLETLKVYEYIGIENLNFPNLKELEINPRVKYQEKNARYKIWNVSCPKLQSLSLDIYRNLPDIKSFDIGKCTDLKFDGVYRPFKGESEIHSKDVLDFFATFTNVNASSDLLALTKKLCTKCTDVKPFQSFSLVHDLDIFDNESDYDGESADESSDEGAVGFSSGFKSRFDNESDDMEEESDGFEPYERLEIGEEFDEDSDAMSDDSD